MYRPRNFRLRHIGTLVVTYVAAVAPLILAKVVLFSDDCHCTLPVLPLKVSEAGLPEQTVVLVADIVPLTEAGLTVIVTLVELAEGHTPLVTTAR